MLFTVGMCHAASLRVGPPLACVAPRVLVILMLYAFFNDMLYEYASHNVPKMNMYV